MSPPSEGSDSGPGPGDPQWERAHQSWELLVAASADDLSESQRRALRRVLRVKRGERDAFFARLPGAVRRGARVDLEPLLDPLREAGIDCRLRSRASHGPGRG